MSTRPQDYVTLSLSDQDLRDQVAHALEQNLIDTNGYKQNVSVRVEDLAWNDDNNRYEITFGIDVEELP